MGSPQECGMWDPLQAGLSAGCVSVLPWPEVTVLGCGTHAGPQIEMQGEGSRGLVTATG
jgi:hypothetical protein